MKYCSECGFVNLDEAKFCRNCGNKLKSATNEAAEKQETSDVNEFNHQELTSKVIVNKNNDSIVSKLFYKTDRYTGELRIAKAKTVSIAVFVLVFLYAIAINMASYSIFVTFFAAIVVGLVFAVPTYIVGYIIGLLVDRINLFV